MFCKTYDEVESDRVSQCLGSAGGFDVGFDFESARGEQDGKGDPESTVGGQSRRTESVTNCHLPIIVPICQSRHTPRDRTRCPRLVNCDLPHASEKLNKTSIAKSQRDDDIVLFETTSTQVDQTQDESGQGKGGETERGGIGEFAILDSLVKTGLEFTSER